MTEQEILEHRQEYNRKVQGINRMPTGQLEQLIKDGKCPYPCEHMFGVPIGMHHCPLCGEMVIAGVPHPSPLSEVDEEELTRLAETAGMVENSKVEFDL